MPARAPGTAYSADTFVLAFSCGRRGTAIAVDEELLQISRHLIRIIQSNTPTNELLPFICRGAFLFS